MFDAGGGHEVVGEIGTVGDEQNRHGDLQGGECQAFHEKGFHADLVRTGSR
jgi:hypothetical protein